MNIVSQSRLGQTDVLIPDDNYLGTVREFMDKDWSDPGSVKLRSGTMIRAVYVKNDSGSAIVGGKGCVYKAGYLGLYVGGLHSADARCDGVADPFVASIANGAYFWLVISGPCNVLIGTSGVSAGDALQTATGGTFIALTDGNTYASGRAGIITADTVDTATGRAYLNLSHQALIP